MIVRVTYPLIYMFVRDIAVVVVVVGFFRSACSKLLQRFVHARKQKEREGRG